MIVRGFSRKGSPTVGNFWVDITRALLYVLFPIAFVGGIILSARAPWTLSAARSTSTTP